MNSPGEDLFLNGRVIVRQPHDGFRAGLDAVMLAAAVAALPGEEVLELGAGAGTAALCLAARLAGVAVTGVEIDPALVALATQNAAANAAEGVRFVEADVLALPADLKREFPHVMCNPPFHESEGRRSPDPRRDRALRDRGSFGDWLETGLKRTASGGSFTAIFRADRLSEALARLPSRGLTIYPLWPRAREAAKRIVLRSRKGSNAASILLPGLVLHNSDGTFTSEAEDILRGMLPLGWDR